jgi:hypothetical protein
MAKWNSEQIASNLLQVTPSWEQHERGADCWCEPTIKRAFMGRVIIHQSVSCKDGQPHKFVWGLCAECGEHQAKVEIDKVAPWLADMYRRNRS